MIYVVSILVLVDVALEPRPGSPGSEGGFRVSILVLVDVALEHDCIFPYNRGLFRFQSLFSWMLLLNCGTGRRRCG